MGKREELANRMLDILDKGFDELHLPFHAAAGAGERVLVYADNVPARFEFNPKTNKSDSENFQDFSEALWRDEREQGSIDMQNLRGYGAYLVDAVRACGDYAQDKDAFKKTTERWKRGIKGEVYAALRNAKELGASLGMSNAVVMKLIKDDVKDFQKDVQAAAKKTDCR